MPLFRDKSLDFEEGAQRAHAVSLIEIGQSLLRSCILLLTAVPVTAIIASGISNDAAHASVTALLAELPFDTQAIACLLLGSLFIGGFVLWKKGLRRIDALDKHNKSLNADAGKAGAG